MLTMTLFHSMKYRGAVGAPRARQHGVVLMISLIILVVMTLGGIALLRSISTAGLITGNLAFQQAATRSGEAAAEDAVRNFLDVTAPATLWNNVLTAGYVAATPASGNPASWEAYWSQTLNPNPVSRPVAAKACVDRVCTLPTDAAGNTASYVIQRLCLTEGDPLMTPTGCSSAPEKTGLRGSSQASGAIPLPEPVKYYYRITARVLGPRNTTSYVQTIVAK